jgi:hypothetical protein
MATDIQVLDPASVPVRIAGREYTQRPLGLRGTAKFLDVLATTMTEGGSFELFQQIGDVDVSDPSGIDVDKIFPVLLQTVRMIPSALPLLLAIVLRAPDDEEFLAEEATPADAMKVVKTFITQNDIPQLVRDFTEVAALFGETVAKATTGSPNGAESGS